jgi:Ca2+-binding RTX toxin-like protein
MRRTVLLLTVMAAVLVMASGVALAVNKVGTNGPDTLRGTNEGDNLSGRGGNDTLFGKGGSDNLLGGSGKDLVLGGGERRIGGGDKNLAGGPGNDVVYGGLGSDNVVGNEGNDLLQEVFNESSEDTYSGGPGNDVIQASNVPASKGFEDLVTCGRGLDRVLADRKDVVAGDCERVVIIRGSDDDVLEQLEEFFAKVPRSFFEGLP